MITIFAQFKPGSDYPPGPLGDVQHYVFDIEDPNDEVILAALVVEYPLAELLHWHMVGNDCTCGLHE
jgi:hypothetical protein